MLPVLFKLGPVPVNTYGLMIALGFLAAVFFMQRDARKAGIDPKVFADGAFYALPLGIIGTRLAHIMMFPEVYSWNDPIGWIAVWRGGLVFQGGPPLVGPFIYFYLRSRKVNVWKAADIVFPYLALAHAFGRVGCFFNGCCYGSPTTVPWAIPFRRVPWDLSEAPTGSAVYLDHLRRFSDMTTASHWSHAVHPTQLYSVLGLMCICLTLVALRKYWMPFDGFTLPVYLIIYGVFRFIVEFFRGDHNPVRFMALTDQQVFCIFFVLIGIATFYFLQRYQRYGSVPKLST